MKYLWWHCRKQRQRKIPEEKASSQFDCTATQNSNLIKRILLKPQCSMFTIHLIWLDWNDWISECMRIFGLTFTLKTSENLIRFSLASNYVAVFWKGKVISVCARDYVNLFVHARNDKRRPVIIVAFAELFSDTRVYNQFCSQMFHHFRHAKNREQFTKISEAANILHNLHAEHFSLIQ